MGGGVKKKFVKFNCSFLGCLEKVSKMINRTSGVFDSVQIFHILQQCIKIIFGSKAPPTSYPMMHLFNRLTLYLPLLTYCYILQQLIYLIKRSKVVLKQCVFGRKKYFVTVAEVPVLNITLLRSPNLHNV